MRLHEHFEWDPQKAAANLVKHGVSFHDAAWVLADDFGDILHLEDFDERHSEVSEDRWITTGSHPLDRSLVLRIIWTEVGGRRSRSVTRIISARVATPRERNRYEREVLG